MKKEKTAIDWLISELFNQGLFDSNKAFSYTNIYRLVREAKKIHKSQIIEAYEDCSTNQKEFLTGNNYYNENYEHQTTD